MADKLTPVCCGCGGEATVKKHTFYRALPLYSVKCDKCGIQVPSRNTEAEAIAAWNRAMGSTEKSSTVERTAKAIEHDASVTDTDGYKYHRSEYLCGECKKKILSGDDYCSHCGAKLDWSAK